jgi:hypothetical protein
VTEVQSIGSSLSTQITSSSQALSNDIFDAAYHLQLGNGYSELSILKSNEELLSAVSECNQGIFQDITRIAEALGGRLDTILPLAIDAFESSLELAVTHVGIFTRETIAQSITDTVLRVSTVVDRIVDDKFISNRVFTDKIETKLDIGLRALGDVGECLQIARSSHELVAKVHKYTKMLGSLSLEIQKDTSRLAKQPYITILKYVRALASLSVSLRDRITQLDASVHDMSDRADRRQKLSNIVNFDRDRAMGTMVSDLMGKVTGELASLGGTMQDCVQYVETSTNRRIIATFQYHKKRADSIENILHHIQLTLLPKFDELPTKNLMQRWLRGVQINQRVTADAQHAAFQTSDTARMIECLYNERMISNNVVDVDLAADFVPNKGTDQSEELPSVPTKRSRSASPDRCFSVKRSRLDSNNVTSQIGISTCSEPTLCSSLKSNTSTTRASQHHLEADHDLHPTSISHHSDHRLLGSSYHQNAHPTSPRCPTRVFEIPETPAGSFEFPFTTTSSESGSVVEDNWSSPGSPIAADEQHSLPSSSSLLVADEQQGPRFVEDGSGPRNVSDISNLPACASVEPVINTYEGYSIYENLPSSATSSTEPHAKEQLVDDDPRVINPAPDLVSSDLITTVTSDTTNTAPSTVPRPFFNTQSQGSMPTNSSQDAGRWVEIDIEYGQGKNAKGNVERKLRVSQIDREIQGLIIQYDLRSLDHRVESISVNRQGAELCWMSANYQMVGGPNSGKPTDESRCTFCRTRIATEKRTECFYFITIENPSWHLWRVLSINFPQYSDYILMIWVCLD